MRIELLLGAGDSVENDEMKRLELVNGRRTMMGDDGVGLGQKMRSVAVGATSVEFGVVVAQRATEVPNDLELGPVRISVRVASRPVQTNAAESRGVHLVSEVHGVPRHFATRHAHNETWTGSNCANIVVLLNTNVSKRYTRNN